MDRGINRSAVDWDLIQEVATRNARVLELVAAAREVIDDAIECHDADVLVDVLRETLELVETLADDLTASRAEGAAAYLSDPDFRQLIDRAAGG